jgi:hypothetical protein
MMGKAATPLFRNLTRFIATDFGQRLFFLRNRLRGVRRKAERR